jgi:hypothetical protein
LLFSPHPTARPGSVSRSGQQCSLPPGVGPLLRRWAAESASHSRALRSSKDVPCLCGRGKMSGRARAARGPGRRAAGRCILRCYDVDGSAIARLASAVEHLRSAWRPCRQEGQGASVGVAVGVRSESTSGRYMRVTLVLDNQWWKITSHIGTL